MTAPSEPHPPQPGADEALIAEAQTYVKGRNQDGWKSLRWVCRLANALAARMAENAELHGALETEQAMVQFHSKDASIWRAHAEKAKAENAELKRTTEGYLELFKGSLYSARMKLQARAEKADADNASLRADARRTENVLRHIRGRAALGGNTLAADITRIIDEALLSWALSPEQSAAFAETILNAPEPNEALKEAAERAKARYAALSDEQRAELDR